MDYAEKILWLKRYRDSRRIQQELEAELKDQQEHICQVTHLLERGPANREDMQSQRAVEKLWEIQKHLVERIEQGIAIRQEVETWIDKVEDPLDQEILRRRYLLGQQWKQIAKEIPMDYRNITKRHRRAVERLPL